MIVYPNEMGGRQLNADARMVYVVHVPQGYTARFDRKGVSPLPEEMEKQSPPEKRASSAEGKGKDGGGDVDTHLHFSSTRSLPSPT